MKVSKERRRRGSRRPLPLIAAAAAGGGAAVLGWDASAAPALMIPALGLAGTAGMLGRIGARRAPYDLTARVPLKLSVRPRVRWLERPFLGWSRGYLGEPRFAMGTSEDSVGTIGPPRVNKSAGAGIAQLLIWGGPAISIAPKPQLFRATADRRRQLAEAHGGRVMIYAPTAKGLVEGLRPVRFSPADSRNATEIGRRVDAWTEAAGTAKDVENGDHWREGAKRILRGLILAAAWHPQRPGDFTLVHRWLAAGMGTSPGKELKDHPLWEPIRLLRGLGPLGRDADPFAANLWAAELQGVLGTAERERSGFFSAAMTTIAATSDPAVLLSTEATDFDPVEFLTSRSSLYIVSPTEHQRAVAPLISMLIDTIVRAAYRLHRDDLLPARLALSLDDLANTAPLPSLESVISQGGGQGVNVFWSLQSLAQLADHYGRDRAEAIWSATRAWVIFGGLGDDSAVQRISNLLPNERVVVGGEHDDDIEDKGLMGVLLGGARTSRHVTWRPLLSPAQLREIPNGWSLLAYHNEPPRMLQQPLSVRRPAFRRQMSPWAVAEADLQAAPQAAEEEV
jgi:type IV secretory pathway TraG/TraD family ATPase VirD4